MSQSRVSQIAELVSKFTGLPEAKIGDDTRLAQDAGMEGDDAAEFFEEFRARCGVDLADFDFEDHFLPEAQCNLIGAAWTFVFDPAARRRGVVPVTVADLARSADAGRWLRPEHAAVRPGPIGRAALWLAVMVIFLPVIVVIVALLAIGFR